MIAAMLKTPWCSDNTATCLLAAAAVRMRALGGEPLIDKSQKDSLRWVNY